MMKETVTLNSCFDCTLRRATGPLHQIKGSNDAGQALLELALVLPFLILLLIGAVEFGMLSYGSIEVSNAAAAGALYGAQNRTNASDNTGITNAAKNDATSLGTLNVTGVTRWCACEGGTAVSVGGAVNCSGFSAASCISPNRIVEWVQVDTSSTIDPKFHYPGLPATFTLRGHATMRVGQ